MFSHYISTLVGVAAALWMSLYIRSKSRYAPGHLVIGLGQGIANIYMILWYGHCGDENIKRKDWLYTISTDNEIEFKHVASYLVHVVVIETEPVEK